MLVGKPEGNIHSEDLGVDGMIRWEGVEWMRLAEDRE